LIVSDLLFRAHPNLTEGELSKLKGFFVSSANLVKYAEQLDLGRYLYLGKGEEKTGGRNKQALLVDAFEAIIGAIYLDGGLESAGNWSRNSWNLNWTKYEWGRNAPLISKRRCRKSCVPPVRPGIWRSVNRAGSRKLFTVDIELNGQILARGYWPTKKAAEQAAARQALQNQSSGANKDEV
jgi:ribonuclease-3